jgi:hypothetical protein
MSAREGGDGSAPGPGPGALLSYPVQRKLRRVIPAKAGTHELGSRKEAKPLRLNLARNVHGPRLVRGDSFQRSRPTRPRR